MPWQISVPGLSLSLHFSTSRAQRNILSVSNVFGKVHVWVFHAFRHICEILWMFRYIKNKPLSSLVMLYWRFECLHNNTAPESIRYSTAHIYQTIYNYDMLWRTSCYFILFKRTRRLKYKIKLNCNVTCIQYHNPEVSESMNRRCKLWYFEAIKNYCDMWQFIQDGTLKHKYIPHSSTHRVWDVMSIFLCHWSVWIRTICLHKDIDTSL